MLPRLYDELQHRLDQIPHLLLRNPARDEHDAAVVRSPSGQTRSSTGGCVRCCTTCTTTGPWQPSTLRKPFTRKRSGARSAISDVQRAREHRPRHAGVLGVDEAADAVGVLGFREETRCAESETGSMSFSGASAPLRCDVDLRARIEHLQFGCERRCVCSPARSVLLITRRSARIACLRASAARASVSRPFTASATVTSTSR